MASVQRPASSGSDSDPRYANIDERKRKRMLSNRESARKENSQLSEGINVSTQRYIVMESANNVLRDQAMELTERLRSLNSVLHIVEEVSGYAVEIPEIPDPLLKPWQLPCLVQPIMASADMFEC
ncbi:hypothetical protein CRYUN_Cryun14cG0078500 [Craigia yunnanensis]